MRSGERPTPCPYFKERQEILKGDASITPICLARSLKFKGPEAIQLQFLPAEGNMAEIQSSAETRNINLFLNFTCNVLRRQWGKQCYNGMAAEN